MVFNSKRSTVFAHNGMVATSQPLAAMTGLRVLMDGGNAVDAAVATAAALAVVEPASTGVGGDVFALVWMAEEKRVCALNASGRAPGTASIEELRSQGLSDIPPNSPYAVTVPGAVLGWESILDRYGTMPIRTLLKPAIKYATDGYPVSELISSEWVEATYKLEAHPSGRELLVGGRPPKPGETVRLPELATTLQTIAEGGADALYKGPLGEKMAGFVQQVGGWLSTEDLARHEVTWEEPIYTDYRGVRCWECPPNSQGTHALMALNLAEGFDIPGMGFQSVDTYHHLIECVRLAYADGLYHITDPYKATIPIEQLLSKSYADRRRALITADNAPRAVTPGLVSTLGDTVYVSCLDGKGNACSFLNSCSPPSAQDWLCPELGSPCKTGVYPSRWTRATPTRWSHTSAPSTRSPQPWRPEMESCG